MWDNPNYWLRLAILRKSLGLSHCNEIGIVDIFNTRKSTRTLKTMGIKKIISYKKFFPDKNIVKNYAINLLKNTTNSAEIINWKLPFNVPGSFVYDSLLKIQKSYTVDVHHPNFLNDVIHCLKYIYAAKKIHDTYNFKLLVLSHPFDIKWGPIGWIGLQKNILMLQPFGAYGVLRFVKMIKPNDLFSTFDHPTKSDFNKLSPTVYNNLSRAGKNYMKTRLHGSGHDLAAKVAYSDKSQKITKKLICNKFEWDVKKKIIIIYASNWYDWPHQVGMENFTDFFDWIKTTIEVAKSNKNINWLFKPHPCANLFGGPSLKNVIKLYLNENNINMVNDNWNGLQLMNSVDGLVTYHGTSGIEFSTMGKPVLVPDKGRYEKSGFVLLAKTKNKYIEHLNSSWWKQLNLKESKLYSELFCGWFFCSPDWQKSFLFEDDSKQNLLYKKMIDLIEKNKLEIDKEIKLIRSWYFSNDRHYHSFKIKKSVNFSFPKF